MSSLVEKIRFPAIVANLRNRDVSSVSHIKAQGEQSGKSTDTVAIRDQIISMFDRSVPLKVAINYVSRLLATKWEGPSDYSLMNDALALILDKAGASLEIAEAQKNGTPPPDWQTDKQYTELDVRNTRALQNIYEPFQVAAASILSEPKDSNLAASKFCTATANMLDLTAKVDNSGLNGDRHINFGDISSAVVPALNRLAGVRGISESPYGEERIGIYMSMNVIGKKLNGQLPQILEANPNLVKYCNQPVTH